MSFNGNRRLLIRMLPNRGFDVRQRPRVGYQQTFCSSAASRCARPLPHGFTGHVARPSRSIVSRSLPLGSTATLAALPAMSLIPVAPFLSAHPCWCGLHNAHVECFETRSLPALTRRYPSRLYLLCRSCRSLNRRAIPPLGEFRFHWSNITQLAREPAHPRIFR